MLAGKPVAAIVTMVLAACTTTRSPHRDQGLEYGADSAPESSQAAESPKNLACTDDQQRVTRDAVVAGCAFDKDASAERRSVSRAQDQVLQDYAQALTGQLDDPAMRQYVADILALPQPDRSARANDLLEKWHLWIDCAFDDAHRANMSRATYVLTVSCARMGLAAQ